MSGWRNHVGMAPHEGKRVNLVGRSFHTPSMRTARWPTFGGHFRGTEADEAGAGNTNAPPGGRPERGVEETLWRCLEAR